MGVSQKEAVLLRERCFMCVFVRVCVRGSGSLRSCELFQQERLCKCVRGCECVCEREST